jgi:pyroglutamyl-peptidase
VILVTGFGPFGAVVDNPSGRLARAVDGATVAGQSVVGRTLPVSWYRGPAETIAWARQLRPTLVLGFGVATSRNGVDVESIGCPGGDGETPDADGVIRDVEEGAPRAASIDVRRLAIALDARISLDAGRYLCNGWLYQVLGALPDTPVGFVHVPPQGLDPDRLLHAIESYVAR